jgi:hypothetical protein
MGSPWSRFRGSLPLEHAWCVDLERRVHEVTWREPGLAYFGVALAPDYVARRMASTRYPENGLLRTEGELLDGLSEDWRT